jgi:hypothetical protein
MTLDYRMPDTRDHRVLRVMGELRSERVIDWVMAMLKLVIGVPLTLIPAAGVTYFLVITGQPIRNAGLTFFVVAAILTSLLIWIERRERQHYLWEATQEHFFWIFPDLLLLGPRLLCEVYDHLRLEPPSEELTALAAKLVVEMLDAGQTVEARSLLRPDRTTTDITMALDYLQHRGWVCISRNRSRVWLGSSVRNQLAGLQSN